MPGGYTVFGGSEPLLGVTAGDSTGWDLTSYPNTTIWDLHENGAPMPSGRVFQVSAVYGGSDNAYLHNGPIASIPRLPTGDEYWRINIPVVYDRGSDNETTCFQKDAINGKSSFFQGFFRSAAKGAVYGIPPYYIAAFLETANATGTSLDGFDSSVWNWMFASAEQNTGLAISALVPMTYRQDKATGTALDARPALGTYNISVSPDTFCTPTRSVLAGNPANNRSAKAFSYSADLRTYRRADSHATFDWGGTWAL